MDVVKRPHPLIKSPIINSYIKRDMELLDLDPDSISNIISNLSGDELQTVRTIRNHKLRYYIDTEVKRRIKYAIKKFYICKDQYEDCLHEFKIDVGELMNYNQPNLDILNYIKYKDIKLYNDFLPLALLQTIRDRGVPYGHNVDIIKFYLDLGVEPNYTHDGGGVPQNLIRDCIIYGNTLTKAANENVKLLLQYGAVLTSYNVGDIFFHRSYFDILDIVKYIFENTEYGVVHRDMFIDQAIHHRLYDVVLYMIDDITLNKIVEGCNHAYDWNDAKRMLFFLGLMMNKVGRIESRYNGYEIMTMIVKYYGTILDNERKLNYDIARELISNGHIKMSENQYINLVDRYKWGSYRNEIVELMIEYETVIIEYE